MREKIKNKLNRLLNIDGLKPTLQTKFKISNFIIFISIIAILIILSPFLKGAKDQKFIKTGNLKIARAGHEAIFLDNGKVLIVGGCQSMSSRTSEIFDLSSKKFILVKNKMNFSHCNPKLFSLKDGNVLIISSEGIELFNSANFEFKKLNKLLFTRYGFSTLLLSNNKILIIGGTKSQDLSEMFEIKEVELYDPVMNEISQVGNLGNFLPISGSTILQDNQILILLDSYIDKYQLLNNKIKKTKSSKLKFKLTSDQQKELDEIKRKTGNTNNFLKIISPQSYVKLSNNRFLILEKYRIKLFYPKIDEVRIMSSKIDNIIFFETLVLKDGNILISGGFNKKNNCSSNVELYDFNNDKLLHLGNMHNKRCGFTQTLLPTGNVLITGGYDYVLHFKRILKNTEILRVEE